ncbi:MAG: hypothetical protein QOJ56_4727 [Mycobacterium sp.]|nr:hypothetical protein [Mycobacterium sp.]
MKSPNSQRATSTNMRRLERRSGLDPNAGHSQDRPSYQAWIVDHGVGTDAGQSNPRSAWQTFRAILPYVVAGTNRSTSAHARVMGHGRVQRLHRVTPRQKIGHDRAAHGIGEEQVQGSSRTQPLAMTNEVTQDDPTPRSRLEYGRCNGADQTNDLSPHSDSI